MCLMKGVRIGVRLLVLLVLVLATLQVTGVLDTAMAKYDAWRNPPEEVSIDSKEGFERAAAWHDTVVAMMKAHEEYKARLHADSFPHSKKP